jgi:hypothetical protein
MRKICVCVIGIWLSFVFLTGCGTNSTDADTTSTTAPPSPNFAVSLSATSLTLGQGAATQTFQVSAVAQNGFTGSVSVTPGALPSGVTVSPSTLTVTPGNPGTFTLSASKTAAISQQTVSVNGTAGALAANASLQLNVTGPSVPDPFHQVGGSMVHGFYDESRQLLFATNLGLNELDVISGKDFSVQARVPIPQPLGIDQMADGKTLVIGTEVQEIVTVDEDSLSVTQHPYSAKNFFYTLVFPNVVALANGKVLIIGQEQGIESSNIVDGGQCLYEWNSNSNTFSQIEPTTPSLGSWETDSRARSADHKWAVFAADQFYLYSSDSDSMVSAPVRSVDPPDNIYGIRGYAINSDGSKIAVASADHVTFLNRSLAVLGTAPIPGAFQTARTAVQFSSDGQRLFLQYSLPLAIEEIDANNYSALGYLSGNVNQNDDNLERLLATDSGGRAYIGNDGGLRLVDLSQSPVPNPPNGSLNEPSCPIQSAILPLNSSQQVKLPYPIVSGNVYVGGQPAPSLGGGTSILIPASSTPGPVDVECIDAVGNTSVLANTVSYGISPVALSANLLPSTGNPVAYLFGYGFSASGGEIPSVSLGGQPAIKVTSLSDAFAPLQVEAVQVPNGVADQVANLAVSSSLGTATLASAATYYSSTIVPSSGLLQLTYDGRRNVVYALKAGEVDVLDAATLQWKPPLPLPLGGASGSFDVMALSPDGSKLVVGESTPQFLVLDPDNISAPTLLTYTAAGPINLSGSIAITKFNKVITSGGLVLDLMTSTFSTLPVRVGQVLRVSADGSRLYSADLDLSSGGVYSMDPATYAAQSEEFGRMFWTDLAVSPDGSQFAAIYAAPGYVGNFIGFFNSSVQFINANVYPVFSPPSDSGVLGATFSPAGKVLVVPLGDSIEFWDPAQGTLRGRLMTPERLHVLANPEGPPSPMIALDSVGQTIYAVSASGLTVIKLPKPLDEIDPMLWPASRPSGNVNPALGGTAASRMAAIRDRLQR